MLCSPPSFRSLRAITGVAKHGAYKRFQYSWQFHCTPIDRRHGARQSSFRRIARALQDVAFSVFQRLPLFRHALFPSGFRLQVNRTAQRYFLRTSPDCVRDSAARSAAHTFTAHGSPACRSKRLWSHPCESRCDIQSTRRESSYG
jgi:hypothetical protein